MRELVICECSCCRAVLNDFWTIWRTFCEHPGTWSIICVATHIVIRGRRVFVGSSIKIDFDEQEYVLILVNLLFLCTSIKAVVSKHLPCLEQGHLVPAPYRWRFFICSVLTLLYIWGMGVYILIFPQHILLFMRNILLEQKYSILSSLNSLKNTFHDSYSSRNWSLCCIQHWKTELQ